MFFAQSCCNVDVASSSVICCGQTAYLNPADAGTLRATKASIKTVDGDVHLNINNQFNLEDKFDVDISKSSSTNIKQKCARARDVRRKTDNARGVCITLSKRSLNARTADQLKSAVRSIRSVKHDNIAGFWDAFEDQKSVMLVYEFVGVVDSSGHPKVRQLMDEIIRMARGNSQWREGDAKQYCYQIASALDHAHDKRVLHGNLKPKNLLLHQTAHNSPSVCKVTDFCLTPAFKCTALEDSTALASEIAHVAPELVAQQEKQGYEVESKEADVYAFGVLAFVMLTGRCPFVGAERADVLKKMKSGIVDKPAAYWTGLSAEAKDLLLTCMATNPKKRPNTRKIVAHPWFATSSKRVINVDVLSLEKMGGIAVMRKSIIQTLAVALPREHITELRSRLIDFDVNQNGMISLDELKDGMVRFPDLDIPQDLLALFDEDFGDDESGTAELNIEQLINAVLAAQQTLTEDVLWQAFKLHDVDGSGTLNSKEMSMVIKEISDQVSEAQITKMMASFDPNGEGDVTFDVFLETFLAEKPPTVLSTCWNSCQRNSKSVAERIITGKTPYRRDQHLSLQERKEKIRVMRESRTDLGRGQTADADVPA